MYVMYSYMSAYIYIYICTYVYVYIYIYPYMYVCVYIYIYIYTQAACTYILGLLDDPLGHVYLLTEVSSSPLLSMHAIWFPRMKVGL